MSITKQSTLWKRMQKTTISKTFFLLLFCCFFATSCEDDDIITSSTLSNDIANTKYVSILENRLSNLPNKAQVAIALVDGERTEFLGAVNENNVLKFKSNADEVFEIGSITKVFTSICLSALVANDEVNLSETLQEQFDFPLKAGGNATLKQLANHTSGIPRLPTNVDEVQGFDMEDPYAIYTHENLKSYLQNHIVLNFESGTRHEYSNLGTGLLGYVLAQKRDTTYEALIQSFIAEPLNMSSTTTLLENVDTSRLIEARDKDGNIVSHWNFAETMSAAGSVKSSVTDMAKFIRKNFEDDPVFNLPQQKTFTVRDNAHQGLGWGILEDGDFNVLLHDGGTGGFSSMIMIDKEKKTGVIVLSNVGDYHSRTSPLCNDLFLEINR